MDLARHLGVGDLASPLLASASRSWRRWCLDDPVLAVIDDLADLPAWTRHASREEKNDVLTRLATLTVHDTDAATTLAWLLLPGATRIASDLWDLHPDIDALVAGQLWIEARQAHELVGRPIAVTVLRATRREVCAQLGVGDPARRRDPIFADAVRDEQVMASTPAPRPERDAEYDVLELLRDALRDKVIASYDVWLVWDLAFVAHHLDAAQHRGRMGLTSPAVVAIAERDQGVPSRTLRRRASNALDRLQEYAAVRHDPVRLEDWKRRHPEVPLTAPEEMELALREERFFDLMTGPERLAPEEALARLPRARWRAVRRT